MPAPTDSHSFLGRMVQVEIDRPLGSSHPTHGFRYPVNYGFLPGVPSGDGEDLDACVLGVPDPVRVFRGRCIAVLRRHTEDDDKLIVVPDGLELSDTEILAMTWFQEQYFTSSLLRTHPGQDPLPSGS